MVLDSWFKLAMFSLAVCSWVLLWSFLGQLVWWPLQFIGLAALITAICKINTEQPIQVY